jgi:DNA-binding beta-propeller fold protein YncE
MRSSYYIYAFLIAVSILSGLNCGEESIAPVIEITGSTVWVIDQPSFTAIIFDSEGDLINTVGGFMKPIDLDIDQNNGDTWIIDFYGDQLKKFDRYGNLLFATPPPIGDDFYLRQPTSVCVEQDTSDVWVADYHQNKVLRLNNSGEETGKITGFLLPRTVNVSDNSGHLWVSDEGARTVYRFSTDFTGEVTTDDAELSVDSFDRPRNILPETGGGCWVLDIGSNRLYKLSPSGEIVATVSGFDEPSYISLGSGGASVLVCDSVSGNVYEIDRRVSGNVNVAVEGQVFLAGLNNPRGLVTDELAGVVYVCVMDEDRVVKCDLETGEELLDFTPIEGPLVADFYRADD